MIYCIWYPSGGFGHFVNSILSYYGDNFVRPTKAPRINDNGNAHYLDQVLPKYLHDLTYPILNLDSSKNYSVLIDNGIDNESEKFKQVFESSEIIKLCYSDHSWPVIAKRHIMTAMKSSLDSQLPLDNWPETAPWAVREKYFLYLIQNPLRAAWRSADDCHNIDLLDLMSYSKICSVLDSIGIVYADFRELHREMLEKNNTFFRGVVFAQQVITALNTNQHIDLQHITDLWDQAVINYFILLEFGVEVPANDYANWFTNTQEMVKLL